MAQQQSSPSSCTNLRGAEWNEVFRVEADGLKMLPSMMPPVQKLIVERLVEVWALSEDVRFGQMLDFLGLMVSANSGQSLAEMEDADLLRILERHRDALKKRQVVAIPAGEGDPECAGRSESVV